MQSLAVKYRPTTFSDVVGQENIKEILQNQLSQNSTKQGYLFTGGAGTGKTTCARIFAKELNGEVIEIDAASNNGVNEIREIREKVKFKPLNHPLKVYIIDEVHMLSTGAFNALLKTLEEPPKHVVFILATTDPQKIPSTILSRVQRFDFKRVPQEQVVERLKHILLSEDISVNTDGEERQVSDEVLEYIAKLTDGGMRDAISLLDTCISYKDTLELQDVFDILGTPSVGTFIQVLGHIYNGNQASLIEEIERLHYDGKDLKVFIKELVNFVVELKKLLLFKGMKHVKVPSIYEPDMKELINHINRQSGNVYTELDKLFDLLSEISYKLRYETSVKVMVEGELMLLCKDKTE